MYAYRNHNQVHSIEVNLNTCDNDVAATSFQSCCTSSSDRNLSTAHLEYIDWIKEIIAVDYKKFKLYVLYCLWIHANTVEAQTTIKCVDYGFTLIKFNQVIPYPAD
jgi:hypothetical protein